MAMAESAIKVRSNMKIIPPYIRDTGSNAERKLFELIKKLKAHSNGVMFHSLNVSEHEYK